MQKKALLALLLGLTLILSGCTLIQKDPEVDAATEIVRMGDSVVTKGEFQKEVDDELNYMAYMYSMYGYAYDATSAENVKAARESVLATVKQRLVSQAKIREMGLDQLTSEEEAQVETNAQSTFDSYVSQMKSTNYASSELSEEEIKAACVKDLEGMGITMDTVREAERESFVTEKLRSEVIKDIAVSDEEVKTEYDKRVETGKTNYESDASSWCSARNNGSTLYYTPAGVRYVQQILIKYDDQPAITDANTRISDANGRISAAQAILDKADATDEEKTQAQADLEAARKDLETAQADLQTATDAAYATIDAEADEVLARLASGEEFETVMAEKTDDPGMQTGAATAERGYAVCTGMASFDSAFVDAAMGLAKPGDVTGKVRGASGGYYIIKYVSDATEGPVELDSVKDTIHSSLLSSKQSEHFNTTMTQWVDATEFKVDLGALDN